MRMKVVILAGDEWKSKNLDNISDARYFRREIRDRLLLRDIEIIDARKLSMSTLEDKIRDIFLTQDTTPLLFIYDGHGGPGCWGLKLGRKLMYRNLAGWVRRYQGPVLFVNNTCFGGTMSEEFERANLPQDKIGVISTISFDTSRAFLLIEQVLNFWKNRRDYTPGLIAESFKTRAAKHGLVKSPRYFNKYLRWPANLLWMYGRAYLLLKYWFQPSEHRTYFSQRWGAVLDYYTYQNVLSAKQELLYSLSSKIIEFNYIQFNQSNK